MAFGIQKIFDGVEIGEKAGSPEIQNGEKPSVVCTYIIAGTSSCAQAAAEGRNFLVQEFGSPPVWGDLSLVGTRLKPVSGVPVWEFEATFSPQDDPDAPIYAFSSTTGTAKTLYSLETVAAVTVDGRDVIDFYGGINANENGGFDGVDREVPTPGFTITQTHPFGWFTRSTRILVMAMIGCINLDYFDGYAPGEVMFKSVEAKTARRFDDVGKQTTYWQATYGFSVMPNRIIDFGGRQVLKCGWDYAWRTTETRENPATGRKESYPIQLNVERIYYPITFSSLCLNIPQ